jgi:hypothetical protein
MDLPLGAFPSLQPRDLTLRMQMHPGVNGKKDAVVVAPAIFVMLHGR